MTTFLTADNPDDFVDNTYYAIITANNRLGGVSLGHYIKRNPDRFAGERLTAVSNEMATKIMNDL